MDGHRPNFATSILFHSFGAHYNVDSSLSTARMLMTNLTNQLTTNNGGS